MGLSFLKFAFQCYDLLAWPLFGQGYPLYASIRAIENNSNQEMRNLVAYWILFSLVSLFELAFAKLINWIPLWCSMKLIATCFLVLPRFNGASYVYECLLRPCFSVDPRGAIKYFIKSKDEKSLSAEGFLLVAERYVAENGSEALEKLLDRKVKCVEPNLAQNKKNKVGAVTAEAIKEKTVAADSGEENKAHEKDKVAAEAIKVKTVAAAGGEGNKAQNENKVAAEAMKEKTVAAAGGGENKAQNKKDKVAAVAIKVETVAATGGEENKATDTEKVQGVRPWGLSQVTTTCKKILDSLLPRKEHKAQEGDEKTQGSRAEASKQAIKNTDYEMNHLLGRTYIVGSGPTHKKFILFLP